MVFHTVAMRTFETCLRIKRRGRSDEEGVKEREIHATRRGGARDAAE